MDKFQRLANEIIDLIEEKMLENNPDVKKLVYKKKGNTMLYGEAYYNLEDEIAEKLREFKKPKPLDSIVSQMTAKAVLWKNLDTSNPEHLKLISAFLAGICFVLDPDYKEHLIKHLKRLTTAKTNEDIIDSSYIVFHASGHIDLV